MSNSLEQQFGDLNLSQEDHDQIFEQEDHQDQRLVIKNLLDFTIFTYNINFILIYNYI